MATNSQDRKEMRTITACKNELNSVLKDYLEKLSSNEDSKNSLNELFQNHMQTFNSRCNFLQKAFYHQHEIKQEHTKGDGGYETAEQLIKGIENQITSICQRMKDAIEYDYQMLSKS